VLCFGALCFCVLASPAGRVFCVFVFGLARLRAVFCVFVFWGPCRVMQDTYLWGYGDYGNVSMPSSFHHRVCSAPIRPPICSLCCHLCCCGSSPAPCSLCCFFACTFRVLRGPPQGLCFVFLCFGRARRACVLCFCVLGRHYGPVFCVFVFWQPPLKTQHGGKGKALEERPTPLRGSEIVADATDSSRSKAKTVREEANLHSHSPAGLTAAENEDCRLSWQGPFTIVSESPSTPIG
jgi:hypothetical protein